MGRDIIFSIDKYTAVYILPIAPEISQDKPQNNETFETINNGTLNIPGDMGLITWSISSILPSKPYSWLRPGSVANPYRYIRFFDKRRAVKKPIRMIVSKDDGTPWFNRLVLIDEFSYSTMRNGDISYTLDISEYRGG